MKLRHRIYYFCIAGASLLHLGQRHRCSRCDGGLREKAQDHGARRPGLLGRAVRPLHSRLLLLDLSTATTPAPAAAAGPSSVGWVPQVSGLLALIKSYRIVCIYCPRLLYAPRDICMYIFHGMCCVASCDKKLDV